MKNKSVQVLKRPHTACDQCPIREMTLFDGIPNEELEWIEKYRHQQFVVPPKTRLYNEHSKPDYVYTLFDGWMSLYQTSKHGKRQILRFVLPGDLLGFQSDANGDISHSAAALTESIVCGYPRTMLKKMFDGQPKLASRLATMESRDMALCQHHQSFGSRKDAHESVAFLLLELFHRSRTQINKSFNTKENSIFFPLTQEDIGDAVGLTNVHVNRVLRQLTKDEFIEIHHRKLKIIDEKGLSELAGFSVEMITATPLI